MINIRQGVVSPCIVRPAGAGSIRSVATALYLFMESNDGPSCPLTGSPIGNIYPLQTPFIFQHDRHCLPTPVFAKHDRHSYAILVYCFRTTF